MFTETCLKCLNDYYGNIILTKKTKDLQFDLKNIHGINSKSFNKNKSTCMGDNKSLSYTLTKNMLTERDDTHIHTYNTCMFLCTYI